MRGHGARVSRSKSTCIALTQGKKQESILREQDRESNLKYF